VLCAEVAPKRSRFATQSACKAFTAGKKADVPKREDCAIEQGIPNAASGGRTAGFLAAPEGSAALETTGLKVLFERNLESSRRKEVGPTLR